MIGGELETFWTVVGKGAAIIGVVVAIIQGIRYLYSIMPSAKLEKRMELAEVKLQKDYEHLQEHDRDIKGLKEKTDLTEAKLNEMNGGIQRLGKSQIALMRHMIDGNGIDQLREEADDLTEYFIER